MWDVRALDAADALTDERAQQHHASLHVAGFYPSLYLNLADNFRRLGSFQAATAYINKAEQHSSTLPDGPRRRCPCRPASSTACPSVFRSRRPPGASMWCWRSAPWWNGR